MLIVSYCTSAAILSRLPIRFSLLRSRQQQMALSISLRLTYNLTSPCSCSYAQTKLRRLLCSSTTTFKPLQRVFRWALMEGICACSLCNRNDIIGHFSRKKHQCSKVWTKIIWLSWTTNHGIRSHSHRKWWCRNPAQSLHSHTCRVVNSRSTLSCITSSNACIRSKVLGLVRPTCLSRFWTI